MRMLLLIPVALALAAAGGAATCVIIGLNLHPREMTLAIAASLISSLAGALPIVLARQASATQLGMTQAALVGTMAHLFAAAGLIAVVILGKLPLHGAFLYWSMAFYWTTLAALVVVASRAIRQAPTATTPLAPQPPKA